MTGSTAAAITTSSATDPSTTTTERTTTTVRATTTTTAQATFDWSSVTIEDLDQWRQNGLPDDAVESLTADCASTVTGIGAFGQLLVDEGLLASEALGGLQDGQVSAAEADLAFIQLADAAGVALTVVRVLESGDTGQAAVTYATQAEAAFAPFLFDAASIYGFVIEDDGIDDEALATYFPPFEDSMKGVIDLAFGVDGAMNSCQ